jgi:hypothetical protein
MSQNTLKSHRKILDEVSPFAGSQELNATLQISKQQISKQINAFFQSFLNSSFEGLYKLN